MFSRLFTVFFAAVTVVTPVLADGNGAVATEAVTTTLSVANKLATGKIGVEEAAGLLGSKETAATLAGALKALEKANGSLSVADMTAIRQVIKDRDIRDASAVVQLFVNASTSTEFAQGKTIAQVFGSTPVTAVKSHQVETVDGMQAVIAFQPKTEMGKKSKEKLTKDFSRTGRSLLTRVAAAVAIAMSITPATCSASAREVCAQQAKELPFLAVAEGNNYTSETSMAFLGDVLKGFEEFKTKNEGVIAGAHEALLMAENKPETLKECFLNGKTSKQ